MAGTDTSMAGVLWVQELHVLQLWANEEVHIRKIPDQPTSLLLCPPVSRGPRGRTVPLSPRVTGQHPEWRVPGSDAPRAAQGVPRAAESCGPAAFGIKPMQKLL